MSGFDSFLFGNVDESGKLENDGWDDELKESLSILSSSRGGGTSFASISSLGITKLDIASSLDTSQIPSEKEPEKSTIDQKIPHQSESSKEYFREPAQKLFPSRIHFTRLFSLSKIRKYRLRRLRIRRRVLNSKILIYAEDEADIFARGANIARWREKFSMNLTSLVAILQNPSILHKKGSKVQASISESLKSFAEIIPPVNVPKASAPIKPSLTITQLHPINLTSWEEFIIYDESEASNKLIIPPKNYLAQLYAETRHVEASLPLSAPSTRPPSRNSGLPTTSKITVSAIASGSVSVTAAAAALAAHQRRPGMASATTSPQTSPNVTSALIKNLATRIPNTSLETGIWEDQIIWDETDFKGLPNAKLILNLNDPNLLFEAVEIDNRKLNRAEKLIAKRLRKLKHLDASGGRLIVNNFVRPLSDKFNLSNDKQYDTRIPWVIRSGKHKQSATAIGRMTLQHAVPAVKLLPPHFKTFLDQRELRQWHRSNIVFPLHLEITFSPTKPIRKTTALSGRLNQVIRKSKDLTLKDGSPALILELTEESPLLMMNSGMATFIYLYYRKKDAKDEFVPEDEVGFGAVLDVSDPSPFWIFGDVPPGQSLYAISNNMFRAVLVRHEPIRNDFICLRYSHKGRVHYYLREVPAVMTVGQIFPAVEIFSPYSRKFLHYGRNRIKVAAYRLFHKDPQGKRLKISRIVSAFPQFSEGSIRKWLKEYSESRRKGPESSGMWYLKSDAPSLSEDDLRALVSPEMACIYEAMLVGQQHLVDLGYQGIFDEDHEEDETLASPQPASVDPRLSQTPWNLSSNVLSAVEGKSLLQVSESNRSAQTFSFLQEKPEEGKGARPRTGEQLIQQKNKLSQVWRNMLLALLNRTQNPLKPIFAEEGNNWKTRLDTHNIPPQLHPTGG